MSENSADESKSNTDQDAVLEALKDFVKATQKIRTWAQGFDDNMPEFKFSGPWPQHGLIDEECKKLRAAYAKHADVLATISQPKLNQQGNHHD